MTRRGTETLAPLVALAALLLLWQAVCSLFKVPEYIFPSPLTIAQALFDFAGKWLGADDQSGHPCQCNNDCRQTQLVGVRHKIQLMQADD